MYETGCCCYCCYCCCCCRCGCCCCCCCCCCCWLLQQLLLFSALLVHCLFNSPQKRLPTEVRTFLDDGESAKVKVEQCIFGKLTLDQIPPKSQTLFGTGATFPLLKTRALKNGCSPVRNQSALRYFVYIYIYFGYHRFYFPAQLV